MLDKNADLAAQMEQMKKRNTSSKKIDNGVSEFEKEWIMSPDSENGYLGIKTSCNGEYKKAVKLLNESIVNVSKIRDTMSYVSWVKDDLKYLCEILFYNKDVQTATCSCKEHKITGKHCKHILASLLAIKYRKHLVEDESKSLINDGVVQYKNNNKETILFGLTNLEEDFVNHKDTAVRIRLPQSVNEISDSAFVDFISLRQIIIPNSVVSIGEGAFYNCRDLESIKIPSSVEIIKKDAFSSCPSIEKITVSGINKNYKSDKNSIIHIKDKRLVAGCKNSLIPTDGSVEKIGVSAFFGCNNIEKIYLSHKIRVVEEHSFSWCKGLKEVTIEDGLKRMEKQSFMGCKNLTKIFIPKTVEYVGFRTFSNSGNLVIYVEKEKEEISFHTDWNADNNKVVYGCSRLDYTNGNI